MTWILNLPQNFLSYLAPYRTSLLAFLPSYLDYTSAMSKETISESQNHQIRGPEGNLKVIQSNQINIWIKKLGAET